MAMKTWTGRENECPVPMTPKRSHMVCDATRPLIDISGRSTSTCRCSVNTVLLSNDTTRHTAYRITHSKSNKMKTFDLWQRPKTFSAQPFEELSSSHLYLFSLHYPLQNNTTFLFAHFFCYKTIHSQKRRTHVSQNFIIFESIIT